MSNSRKRSKTNIDERYISPQNDLDWLPEDKLELDSVYYITAKTGDGKTTWIHEWVKNHGKYFSKSVVYSKSVGDAEYPYVQEQLPHFDEHHCVKLLSDQAELIQREKARKDGKPDRFRLLIIIDDNPMFSIQHREIINDLGCVHSRKHKVTALISMQWVRMMGPALRFNARCVVIFSADSKDFIREVEENWLFSTEYDIEYLVKRYLADDSHRCLVMTRWGKSTQMWIDEAEQIDPRTIPIAGREFRLNQSASKTTTYLQDKYKRWSDWNPLNLFS